ncbi:MAG: hypothetical protein IT426_19270 [Pirellulales bacterium]|nr:hypothetical protein [Pirellulales bacterium]
MKSDNSPRLGRILYPSVLAIIFCCETLGAEPNQSPRPELPGGESSIAGAKAPTAAAEKAADAVAAEPASQEPQELPPAKAADRPSPLRAESAGPTGKKQAAALNPEADSSGMAAKLKASAGTSAKANPPLPSVAADEPAEEQPLPTDKDGGGETPKQNQKSPDAEIHPIAPDDAPGAVATDRDAPETPSKGAAKSGDDKALEPVPDSDLSGPAPLEAASFNGVTPGQTTLAEVEKAWGSPKEMFKQNEQMTQLYSIEPFDRIEVGFEKEKVASIIVRFQKPFAAEKIAQQLDMAAVKPVLIANDVGEVLGQSYPERGVLFAFEPSAEKTVPSYKVTHIVLEPIAAEPFVLRAETVFDSRYDRSLLDLRVALTLQPDCARAHWLTARIFAAQEQFEKAEAAAAEAARLEPNNVRYCITHAQILGQMGRLREALAEIRQAFDSAAEQPHLRAKALCLQGDLTASGPKPDYRQAIGYHAQALRAADRAAADVHPAVRRTAKEALVDAHLGSAHDIAWGDWKDKEKAVTLWLKRAAAIAEDLMKNEDGTAEQLFRVQTRGLSALVGIRPGVDPAPWVEEALRAGNELIDDTGDPIRKAQYQWDLGMALYDAVQICQLRADHAAALRYGEEAVEYLEEGYARKQSPTTAYLLGRLYFRLGAIHAIRDKDHPAAVQWFEKAVPLLDKPVPDEARADLGRFGETFVSMGVSYWETGDRNRAVELTIKGVKLMEEAVNQGTLERSALAIPYGNLAAMQRQIGKNDEAAKYSEMAARIKNAKTR